MSSSGLNFYKELPYRTLHHRMGTNAWWTSGIKSLMEWENNLRKVFEGLSPNLARVVMLASEDLYLWSFAGARGISFLLALVLLLNWVFFRSRSVLLWVKALLLHVALSRVSVFLYGFSHLFSLLNIMYTGLFNVWGKNIICYPIYPYAPWANLQMLLHKRIASSNDM